MAEIEQGGPFTKTLEILFQDLLIVKRLLGSRAKSDISVNLSAKRKKTFSDVGTVDGELLALLQRFAEGLRRCPPFSPGPRVKRRTRVPPA